MEYFKNCPQCGCDLSEEKRKREERIEKILNEEHGEALRGARIRSKLLWGFAGALLGFVTGVVSAVILTEGLQYLDVYNPDLLGFIGLSTVVLSTYSFGYFFVKDAIPKEERYLRRRLKSEMQLY